MSDRRRDAGPHWTPHGVIVIGALLFVLLVLSSLSGCSTANNWKMPPYEVKRVELTCDRTTRELPPGLICVCRQYGSTWDCQVMRIE